MCILLEINKGKAIHFDGNLEFTSYMCIVWDINKEKARQQNVDGFNIHRKCV